jgi:hypothetical protein
MPRREKRNSIMSGSHQHQQHHAAPHENGANFSAGPRTVQPVVRLEQTPGGMWDVRDQSNRRGGLFRDYRAAARFIKHEFQLTQPSLVIVSGGKETPTS